MSSRQTSLFGDPVAGAYEPGLRAPFPYFGGKRSIASLVWYAFGEVKQYVEPFCGSAAILLAAPRPASLEVIGDVNFYIANFWRAVKFQPDAVAVEVDYPVSHVDLAARHRWLVEPARTAELIAQLADPEWPGDARIAGWWCWGQCAWIGSGWCESQIPHVTNAGQGVQSQIPHVGDAGRGVQSQIPHVTSAGLGTQASNAAVRDWMHALSTRLARVRVIHGAWDRCLNVHYGNKGKDAAIFFDPPYVAYERLYGKQEPVALDVARWAAEHAEVRIAVCGHVGDYDGILDGWQSQQWGRPGNTYGGAGTRDSEMIWFSPACKRVK